MSQITRPALLSFKSLPLIINNSQTSVKSLIGPRSKYHLCRYLLHTCDLPVFGSCKTLDKHTNVLDYQTLNKNYLNVTRLLGHQAITPKFNFPFLIYIKTLVQLAGFMNINYISPPSGILPLFFPFIIRYQQAFKAIKYFKRMPLSLLNTAESILIECYLSLGLHTKQPGS